MTLLAVGIPTYREADTIGNVVRSADAGLCRLVKPPDGLLINVDGNSPDATAEAFLAVPTAMPKISLSVHARPGGKGANLFELFRYCKANGVDHAVTLDGDLQSIDAEWVPSLLSPLLEGRADFVAPAYRRSRFEGSITNHFAFPMIRACLRVAMRQPIGGEFAFSRALVAHVLAQPAGESVFGYGIDIFLSIHAAAGPFRIAQAPLGKKIHKPTFQKMERMFFEVASTALALLARAPISAREILPSREEIAFDDDLAFPHRDAAASLFSENRANALARLHEYRRWPGIDFEQLRAAIEPASPSLDAGTWPGVLAAALREAKLQPHRVEALSRNLWPLFLLRTLSSWRLDRDRPAEEIEGEVLAQARSLDRLLRCAGPVDASP